MPARSHAFNPRKPAPRRIVAERSLQSHSPSAKTLGGLKDRDIHRCDTPPLHANVERKPVSLASKHFSLFFPIEMDSQSMVTLYA